MKKLAAILLALMMTASLAACGGESSDTKETSAQNSATAVSETQAEETTAEPTTVSTEVKTDDSGEGEKTLDTVFCTATIPEGLQYEVDLYSHSDDNTGTLTIGFGKVNSLEGKLEVSTTRMVSSLDDAVEECIRTRNLDTYKEGKSEVGEEKTFGDTTYKLVNMSHEYGSESCLVTYYKRADGVDMYVEICAKDNGLNSLEIDDPLVEELANSIVLK